jgi:hypothetical protein
MLRTKTVFQVSVTSAASGLLRLPRQSSISVASEDAEGAASLLSSFEHDFGESLSLCPDGLKSFALGIADHFSVR